MGRGAGPGKGRRCGGCVAVRPRCWGADQSAATGGAEPGDEGQSAESHEPTTFRVWMASKGARPEQPVVTLESGLPDVVTNTGRAQSGPSFTKPIESSAGGLAGASDPAAAEMPSPAGAAPAARPASSAAGQTAAALARLGEQ